MNGSGNYTRRTGVVLKKTGKPRKKKIPKAIKIDSWNKYVGKELGVTKCFAVTR